MNGTIDPGLLALFARVARAGGVRSAALESGLPRSTVSRRLAELEGLLGTRLVQRTTRAVTLTEEGKVLLERIVPALGVLADAEGAVRALREKPTGTLRVAATGLSAEVFLSPVFARYAERYPDVRIEVALEDRVVSLADEGFDCALRVGAVRDSSLVARKLGAGSLRAYASAAYLRARGEPARPRDLAAHDAIVFTGRREPNRWPFRVRGKTVLQSVAPRVSVNSFVMVRDLCVAGVGVALLPEFLALEALRRGTLREVLGDYATDLGPVNVVYPSGRHLALRTRAFVDMLVTHFEGLALDGRENR